MSSLRKTISAVVETPPVWVSTAVSQALTVGSAYSKTLQGGTVSAPDLVQDPDGGTLVISGAVAQQSPPNGYTQGLPPGVTLNNGVLSGTPTTAGSYAYTLTAAQSSSSGADFATRAATGRVVMATDFSSLANDFNQTTRVFGSNSGLGIAYWKSLVTQATGQPRVGTALRIDSPASSGAGGSAWFCSMNPGGFSGALGSAWTTKTQGMGSTGFYTSMRVRFPASRLVPRASNGFKYWDLACYAPEDPQGQSRSNTLFECVGENTNWTNRVTAYHRDQNGSFPPFNNPVAFNLVADEWIALKMYVQCQTYGGTTGNVFRMWAARQDATAWTQIYDESNVSFGAGVDGDPTAFPGGYNGVWLNAFETNGTAPYPTDTHQLWSQLIVSLDDIALPAVGS